MPSFSLSSTFTICAWFNPTSNAASYPRVIEISRGRSADNVMLRRNVATADLTVEIWSGATSLVAYPTYTGKWQGGAWQHVCLAVGGTSGVLYHNGIPAVSTSSQTTFTLSAAKPASTLYTIPY
jgi:hypothetical protein